MESIQAAFRREGLVRPKNGRVLGGVVAGLGRRIGLDPWPARLLFVLLLMLIPGSQLLVYPILWILMPQDVAPRDTSDDQLARTRGLTPDGQRPADRRNA
jgi:phage shock protein C